MKKLSLFLALVLFSFPVSAFTGFLVGDSEAPIAVPATKLIIATHNGRHTLSMLPSVASSEREFAFLFPVPANVTAQNVREVSASLFDAVDTLTAPRLREETDGDPCPTDKATTAADVKSYAVTGRHVADDTRYDISVLSPEQGLDLVKWLEDKGYKLPPKTDRIILPYTQRGNAFLLIKARRASAEAGYLKPLQIAYDAPKLVLPVRLGLINAPAVAAEKPRTKGFDALNAAPDANYERNVTPVDVFNDGGQAITLYVVSQLGRAGSPLMRSIPLNGPRMDMSMPSYATRDFPSIYNRILNMRVKSESNALIVEYADEAQLPADVLSSIGVNWLNEAPKAAAPIYDTSNNDNLIGGMMLPKAAYPKHLQRGSAQAGKPYLTRLYFRYNATTLRQDIAIEETPSRETQSIRFSTHLPAANACADVNYQQSLSVRDAHDEENLARLSGWSKAILRQKFKE